MSNQYDDSINTWREQVEKSLRSENGWLSVVGLEWLNEGENTLGSNPTSDVVFPLGNAPETIGTLTLQDGVVTLHVTTDEPVFVDGEAVTSAILQNDLSGASMVKVRDVTFFILKRGDAYAVRIRDPKSPARSTFTGRKWFPIDPAYRVRATFHPYDDVQSVEVDNIIGTKTTMQGVGYVTFELGGQDQRLIAFDGGNQQLWFILRDPTSGAETYGSGRFLMADLAEDGTVDLDFNKSHNPPCAFTHFATCPLPPRENHLQLAITAGEKVPN